MIRTKHLALIVMLMPLVCPAQKNYDDSIKSFIKNYIDKHDVVAGDDKKYLSFYPINDNYRVVASFERVRNGRWFTMETSGSSKKTFRVYGVARFRIHDTTVQLNIYQSQGLMAVAEFKDYLFLPFSDLTSGEETYDAGRYIDLKFEDVVDNKVVIDFNKAYNPSCAYVNGVYNCPIPPKENSMNVAILAGEKNFGKKR